jgi:hypothetical protein
MEEIKGEIKEPSSVIDIEKRKKKLYNFFFGWVKDNYDKAFLAILAAAFAIGLWIFFLTKGQPVWYDTANFLSTAKKLALNLTNVNDIWYYRRGFLWVLFSAFFFKTGIGEIGIQFSGVLFYLGLMTSSYFLIRDMFNKKLALFTVALFATSWVLLFFMGRSMTEIPASFLLITALFFFWKGYVLKKGNKFLYLFGLFYALALLTRFQLAMFALPIIIFILTKEKLKFIKNKPLWTTVGIGFLVLLPFFILYALHYGNVFADVLSHYFGVSVAADTPTGFAAAGLLDYFKDLPYMLTIPLFVIFLVGVLIFFQDMVLGIDKLLKNEEIQKKFFIFMWIVPALFILGYMTSASYVEERYAFPTFIFLFLIIANVFIKASEILISHFKFKKVTALVLCFLVLLGATIPGIIFAHSLIENKKTSYLEVEQSALWIKQNSNSSDIIFSNSVPYMTYYAERQCHDIPVNKTLFEEEISTLHPKYLMLSVFEAHETWEYDYPQNHTDILKPVQAFYNQDKPVVVIYEFTN